MQLTEKQLTQRWEEFEALWQADYGDAQSGKGEAWRWFIAAWRPIPTVKEIAEYMKDNLEVDWTRGAHHFLEELGIQNIEIAAQAIRRAFGGEDDE